MIVYTEGKLKGIPVLPSLNKPEFMSIALGIEDEFLIYAGY
jgi:hypothetical protein